MTLVRGYNLDTLWLCLLQNKVEELNQRLRQAMDGQCFMMIPFWHTVWKDRSFTQFAKKEKSLGSYDFLKMKTSSQGIKIKKKH